MELSKLPKHLPSHLANMIAVVTLLLHLCASTGCSQGDQTNTPQEVSGSNSQVQSEQTHKALLDSSTELAPWKFIVLHHSATTAGSVESIHEAHRQRRDSAGNPWLGIGYHFVIGNGNGMEDGEVASTFRWKDQIAGAHAGLRAYNETGIGICLIGNFENQKPTTKQVKSAAKLVRLLKIEFGMTAKQVLKHGDFKATACPGRQFPFEEIVSSNSQGPEVAQQLKPGKSSAVFQPVKPGRTEEVRNVAAFSRSKFRAGTQSNDNKK